MDKTAYMSPTGARPAGRCVGSVAMSSMELAAGQAVGKGPVGVLGVVGFGVGVGVGGCDGSGRVLAQSKVRAHFGIPRDAGDVRDAV